MTTVTPVATGQLPAPSAAAVAAVAAMGRALHGRVSSNDSDRIAYSRDMWSKGLIWIRQGRIPPPPDAVVWPASEEELVQVVQLARAHRVPLVPFGAGSGVCGATIALRGGVAVDLKRMEKIGRVDASRLCVDVEAGAMGEVLERDLNVQGYTLGHFPSSIYMSTVGGWLAARSAGQLSNRYGKIEDMTLSVRAVTGKGEILETPERPHPGPDLSPLLVGSEGALCIFTRARLRVHPAPELRAFRGIKFRTVADGVEAIRAIYRAGIRPAVVRLYDPFDTALVGRGKEHSPRDVPPSLRGALRADVIPAALRKVFPLLLGRPSLINRAADALHHCLLVLMFEGEARRTADEASAALSVCKAKGGTDQGEGPGRAWYARRYDVSYRMSKVVDDGGFADTMEVATTWDKVVGVYEGVRAAVAPLAFTLCHFSHAYVEGCSLYFSFVGSDWNEAGQERRYDALWAAAQKAALATGANLSHHHGVGLLKQSAFQEELGERRALLVALKAALDPDGILNPGKLSL